MMDYLDSLNDAQREAVLDREHNLLILACAGSGKTRTITSKIAYYIESGYLRPYEILAVTFTNKAAQEMRERLGIMLSDYDISSLEIRTFHSFGAWVLRRHADDAGLPHGFQIYDDSDSVSLLSSLFPDVDKREVRSIYNAIAQAKERGISPTSGKLEYFAKDIDDLGMYYQEYDKALRGTGNCDFADLILKPVILFNKYDDIRERYQKRFKLILVDEYQDSNKMQFELLSLVSSSSSQLCVVGDDDQSIYSFRGADIENILSFNKSFKNVREIKLEKNYRSTSEILSLASAIIKNNKERHKKEIISFDGHHGKKPELITNIDGRGEAEGIISRIRRIDDYDNTAIIYRTNAQSLEFEKLLGVSRIPYRVVGALKFYEREEVKDALAILRLLSNRMDVINFRRIINKPARGLGDKTVEQIIGERNNLDVISALSDFVISSKSGKARSGAESFLSAYEKVSSDLDEGMPLGALLSEALECFGLKEYFENEKDESIRQSKNENLSALVSSLSEYGAGRSSLESYLENITLDNTTPGGSGKDDRAGVTLITMHDTKGLEFDYVFVAGLEDELIPGSRSSQSAKGLEEERRLFYVAVTRARKELYLSYAAMRTMWGRRDYRNPSRYLDEIPKDLYGGAVYKKSYNPYSYVGSKVEYRKKNEGLSNVPSWASNIEIKARRKEEKKEIPLFSIRDEVSSPLYGKGVITDIKTGEIGHRLLTIDFEALGSVRFNEGTANLSLLSKGDGGCDKNTSSHFEVEDKVRSPAYGDGVVKKVAEINGKRVLTVLFSSGKEIKLMEGYSKLEKLDV